jgi:hypothetical protein
MADELITAPQEIREAAIAMLDRPTKPLFADIQKADSFVTEILKAREAASSQGVKLGRQDHPFDLAMVRAFLTGNEHHAACIGAKVASTTGLGFVDGEEEVVVDQGDQMTGEPAKKRKQFVDAAADLSLDELCLVSFADVLHDVTEDFFMTGNGYIEAVRDSPGGEIVGLHHLPADEVYIYIEDEQYNMHYEVQGKEGATAVRRFARFGEGEDFAERSASEGVDFTMPTEGEVEAGSVEVIHLRNPSSLNRWYGMPDWLAAVPPIELTQMLMQWKYDFFLNRGVPEFMLFIFGQKLVKEDWDKVQNALQANIGLGNSHKSLALNLSNENIKIQLEKLGIEGKSDDDFGDTSDSLATRIVTAHRVPPLLAGIQIPGKLGATNELPNALMSFQILYIGPKQRLVQRTLGKTLGGEYGVSPLSVKDFAFKKITEEIDVGQMDTVARMRQTPMQARSEGRDLKDGPKE